MVAGRLLVVVACGMWSACSGAERSLDPQAEARARQTGAAFAEALTLGRFEEAHGYLDQRLQAQLTVTTLRARYAQMIAYGSGPARVAAPAQYDAMLGWKTWRRGDLGWVYLPLEGQDFQEAVTIIVADEHGQTKIRELEFGRP